MAYIPKKPGQDDLSDQQQAPGRIMSGYGAAAPTTGPQFGAPVPVTGGMKTAPQDSGPSATGYVNFDRFFNANQSGAEKTAQKTQQDVANKADTAKASLGKLQQGFGSAVQQGTVQGPDQGARDYAATGQVKGPVSSQVAQAQPSAAVANQAAARAQSQPAKAHDPTADEYQSQINARKNGTYSGPTSLDVMSGYGNASQQAHAAQDALDATKSQGGLQGLLQSENQGAPGGYSDAQSAFDAALVGQAGGQGFANQRNYYGNFEDLFNNAAQQAGGQVGQAQQASKEAVGQWGAVDAANQARQAAPAPGDGSVRLDAAGGTLGPTPGSTGAGAGTSLGSASDYVPIMKDMGIATDNDGHPTTVADKKAMQGMTDADWKALSNMTPEQRKAWWDKRKAG